MTVCPISSVKLQGNTMVTGSIDKAPPFSQLFSFFSLLSVYCPAAPPFGAYEFVIPTLAVTQSAGGEGVGCRASDKYEHSLWPRRSRALRAVRRREDHLRIRRPRIFLPCTHVLTRPSLMTAACREDHGLNLALVTHHMQDVKYWRLDTGRCFKTLSGHTERVCALRFDQQILATASQDLTVRYRVPTTPMFSRFSRSLPPPHAAIQDMGVCEWRAPLDAHGPQRVDLVPGLRRRPPGHGLRRSVGSGVGHRNGQMRRLHHRYFAALLQHM